MKKIVALLLVLMATCLIANPIDPSVIQQLYFDGNDDLIIQFGDHAAWLAGSEVSIHCGGQSLDYLLQEGEYPLEINLSELLPEISVNRDSGSLTLETDIIYLAEFVNWGNTEDCDVSPLQNSESIYQYLQVVHGEWEDYTLKTWAKSPDPAMVEYYHCDAGFELSIGVRNLQHEPLANIPVYYQDFSSLIGYTDQNGSLNVCLPARRTRIRVYHPESPATPVYDQSFMGEPYGLSMHTVVMDYTGIDDPQNILAPAALNLSPSLIHPGESILVEYGKESPNVFTLELYDIKGRYISSYDYREAMRFTPPALGSGMYFLRLKDGERALDTKKFILLK